MLTREQIAYFYTFGFLVLRGVLSANEIAIMKRESLEIFEKDRKGLPYDNRQWQAVQPFFEWSPFLSSLVEDDRIYGIGESLLGPHFLLAGTEGNLHVGDTQWHATDLDSDYGGSPHLLQFVKVAFYLEPLDSKTGSLRVIPGSQHRTFAEQLQEGMGNSKDSGKKAFGLSGRDIPCVTLDCKPGDIIVFMESLFHSAFGGKAGRHQHAVNFFASPETQGQEDWLRRRYEEWEYALHPAETFANSNRPKVRHLVQRLVDMGFETSKKPW